MLENDNSRKPYIRNKYQRRSSRSKGNEAAKRYPLRVDVRALSLRTESADPRKGSHVVLAIAAGADVLQTVVVRFMLVRTAVISMAVLIRARFGDAVLTGTRAAPQARKRSSDGGIEYRTDARRRALTGRVRHMQRGLARCTQGGRNATRCCRRSNGHGRRSPLLR